MIKKYIKKPVEIEAIQFNEDTIREVLKFVHLNKLLNNDDLDSLTKNIKMRKKMFIKTLEGKMEANFGDYVIKGIKGEFYPCKPDIFEATYHLKGGIRNDF